MSQSFILTWDRQWSSSREKPPLIGASGDVQRAFPLPPELTFHTPTTFDTIPSFLYLTVPFSILYTLFSV